jgi:hypothetical protein
VTVLAAFSVAELLSFFSFFFLFFFVDTPEKLLAVRRSVDKALNTEVCAWVASAPVLFEDSIPKRHFKNILPFPLQKILVFDKINLKKISAYLKIIYNWCQSC